jgi:hypothetical protein
LQGRELAPRDWTVMLDEAQDADPVILGLLERQQQMKSDSHLRRKRIDASASDR